jgi:polar amino acid transport system substrate-binding protein
MPLARSPRAFLQNAMPRARIRPIVVAGLVVVGACGLPKDADGTLDRVRGGAMRVGVVVDTPWVTDSAGAAGGVEGALVAQLARELGARVEWVRRPESALLQSLHDRELDLVIGGFTDASPWKAKVALTRPYYTDTVVVAVAHAPDTPTGIQRQPIAVTAGDPLVAVLRGRGATPRPVRDLALLRDSSVAVAAPLWRLDALRRVSLGVVVHEAPHVLALPPGENAWMVFVERLLHAREATIPAALRAAAR